MRKFIMFGYHYVTITLHSFLTDNKTPKNVLECLDFTIICHPENTGDVDSIAIWFNSTVDNPMGECVKFGYDFGSQYGALMFLSELGADKDEIQAADRHMLKWAKINTEANEAVVSHYIKNGGDDLQINFPSDLHPMTMFTFGKNYRLT